MPGLRERDVTAGRNRREMDGKGCRGGDDIEVDAKKVVAAAGWAGKRYR